MTNRAATLRRIARIALPLLAFLPGCILLLNAIGIIGDGPALNLSLIALLPALSLATLCKSFGYPGLMLPVVGIAGLIWSAFIAAALRKFARLISAEDFSWADFWFGLVLGFIPGALMGWRAWIKIYKHASLPTCLVIGGLAGGIALGVYMGSCWSKARYED